MAECKNNPLADFEEYKKSSRPSIKDQRTWLINNIKRFDEQTRQTILDEILPELLQESVESLGDKTAHEAEEEKREVEILKDAIRRAREDRTDIRELSHREDCKKHKRIGLIILALSLCSIAIGTVAFFSVALFTSLAAAIVGAILGVIAFKELERSAIPVPPQPILPSFHQNETFYASLKGGNEVLLIIEIYYEFNAEIPHTLVRIKNQVQRRLGEYFTERDSLPTMPLLAIDRLIQPDIPALRKELRIERLKFRTLRVHTPPITPPRVQESYFTPTR